MKAHLVGGQDKDLTSFINFGAFTAFTCVNLSVITVFVTGRASQVRGELLFWVAAPTLGAICDLWLMASLDQPALVLGGIWLCPGLTYLLYLTGLFQRPPPRMHTVEGS